MRPRPEGTRTNPGSAKNQGGMVHEAEPHSGTKTPFPSTLVQDGNEGESLHTIYGSSPHDNDE